MSYVSKCSCISHRNIIAIILHTQFKQLTFSMVLYCFTITVCENCAGSEMLLTLVVCMLHYRHQLGDCCSGNLLCTITPSAIQNSSLSISAI